MDSQKFQENSQAKPFPLVNAVFPITVVNIFAGYFRLEHSSYNSITEYYAYNYNYIIFKSQRVYDTTHLHLMQEMDKKIFLEGNTEVQEEYNTWFLQGYALLLSACELTGACPPELQVQSDFLIV